MGGKKQPAAPGGAAPQADKKTQQDKNKPDPKKQGAGKSDDKNKGGATQGKAAGGAKANKAGGSTSDAALSKKQAAEKKRLAAQKANQDKESEYQRMLNPDFDDDEEFESSEEEEAAGEKTTQTTPETQTDEAPSASSTTSKERVNFAPEKRNLQVNHKADHQKFTKESLGSVAPPAAATRARKRVVEKNEQIDLRKQFGEARAELKKLETKAAGVPKGLSNKDKRTFEKLSQKVLDLEDEVQRLDEEEGVKTVVGENGAISIEGGEEVGGEAEAGSSTNAGPGKPKKPLAPRQLLEQKYLEKLRPFHLQIEDLHDGGNDKRSRGKNSKQDTATEAADTTSPATTDAADLIIERFSISVKGQKLFDDAKLQIAHGRRYGFLGPNGRGKSTLLLHIAARKFPLPSTWDVVLVEQEVDSSDTRTVVEEVLFADQDLERWRREETEVFAKLEQLCGREEDGSEKQTSPTPEQAQSAAQETIDLESLVARAQQLGDLLAEKDGAEGEVRKILAGLGFTDAQMDWPTDRFSGGWRMRMAIAKGLFVRPKLLLLDEPTNHLDLEAAFWLEDYLSKYPHTVITVSHDAEFLDSVCTDIMALTENSKLLYAKGGYNAYKQKRDQERASALKELKKANPKATAASLKLGAHKEYVVNFAFAGGAEERGKNSVALGIGVNDVSFGYNKRKGYDESTSTTSTNKTKTSASTESADRFSSLLFDRLCLRVDEDSRIALVGPNGCGKSTLLRLLMKMIDPTEEADHFRGEGSVDHSRGLRIGYYSQHFDELLPLSDATATSSSKAPAQAPKGKARGPPVPCSSTACSFLQKEFNLTEQQARAKLGSFGLPSKQHLIPLTELSGGQKARVCFAKICLSKPHLLIFDEPTNHLDIESVEALIEALDEYKGGVILVSHDARLVQALTSSSSNKNDAAPADAVVYRVGKTSAGAATGLEEINFRSYVRHVLNEIELRALAMQQKLAEKQQRAKQNRKELLAKTKHLKKK
ncbi:unnamed protein product [Amoebophrya sp. A25]|nr:unnamed protein product [Amoebophrya sp. A25]|eukprot:GSA25T00012341001.1